MNIFELDILVRFILIIACSSLIGFNRGKMNQFAGLKTHLFVGLGAGLSFFVPYIFYMNNEIYTLDPFRLSAQVISGIGFLGAGTIIKSGHSIKGLTTAAGLWATAIIAISIASGLYLLPIAATLIIFLVLMFGKKIDISRKYETMNLIITISDKGENLSVVDEFMKSNTVLQNNSVILKHRKDGDNAFTMLKYEIVHKQTNMETNDVIKKLSNFDFVKKIDLVTELEKI